MKYNRLFIFILTFFTFSYFVTVFGQSESDEVVDTIVENTSQLTERISCGKVLDEDILCVEELKCGEEEILENLTNKDLPYRKVLEFKREYRKLDQKTNEYKTLSICFIKATFSYDKKGNVKVNTENADFKFINSDEKWFLMNAKKILSSENSKTMGFIFSLYKQNKLGDFIYKIGGHADIFCTSKGELGICTDLI